MRIIYHARGHVICMEYGHLLISIDEGPRNIRTHTAACGTGLKWLLRSVPESTEYVFMPSPKVVSRSTSLESHALRQRVRRSQSGASAAGHKTVHRSLEATAGRFRFHRPVLPCA